MENKGLEKQRRAAPGAIDSKREYSGPDDPVIDFIPGRTAVLEALKSGRAANTLFVVRGGVSGPVSVLAAMCRERKIPVKEAAREKLDHMCPGANHQGVVLSVPPREYAEISDMLELAAEREQAPFIVICDEIEDPHNLGAIIRTAEAAGAHGVIIQKRRAAGLTYAVAKAAAGALEYLPVARVPNISAAIEELKAQNIWIYGAEMEGKSYTKTDFSGAAAIVIGSEGRGLSRLVKERCDFLVSIPMPGKTPSLNASVAAAILIYEVTRNRAIDDE